MKVPWWAASSASEPANSDAEISVPAFVALRGATKLPRASSRSRGHSSPTPSPTAPLIPGTAPSSAPPWTRSSSPGPQQRIAALTGHRRYPRRTNDAAKGWAAQAVKQRTKPLHAAVRAWCGLSVNAKKASAVLQALERLPEVEELCAVSGAFDYLALLCCNTPEQLDRLLDQLGQIEGIHQTHTSLILSRKIDRRSQV